MNNLYTLYTQQKRRTQIKFKQALKLHRDIRDKIQYLYECIGENKNDIPRYDDLISKLKEYNKTGKKEHIYYIKVKLQYPEIVKVYLTSIIICIDRRRGIAKYGKILDKKRKLKREDFGYLLKEFNKGVQENILEGYCHNFGWNLASIELVTKDKIYNEGQYAKRSIDWNASIEELKRIIRIHKPDLVDKYEQKIISRKGFIQQSKPYTYNPESNPLGDKWIMYHLTDDFTYVVWNKGQSRIPNKYVYRFIPTNFINGENRSMNALYFSIGSKNEIIKNQDIGFVNKLTLLNRFDKTFKNKFRKDDSI